MAAKASGSAKTVSEMAVELGAKIKLDNDAFVKIKTNSTGHLGLGYTQVLRPGFQMTLGGLFDTARLNENAHKLGVSLSIDF